MQIFKTDEPSIIFVIGMTYDYMDRTKKNNLLAYAKQDWFIVA